MKFYNWIKIKPRIGTKIAVVYSSLIALIIFAIYLYMPYRLKEHSLFEVKTLSSSISKMCAFSISPGLFFRDELSVEEALLGARKNEDVVYIVVLDDSGAIFASFNYNHAVSVNYHDIKNQFSESNIYKYSTPVQHNGKKIGDLFIGVSLNRIDDTIRQTKGHITVASILIFAIGLLCVLFLSNVITKPIKILVRTFNQISKGDLTKRVPINSEDELGQMSSSFNYMVDNLEEVYKEIEDVNHMLEVKIDERTKELQQEIDDHTVTVEKLYKSETKTRAFLNAIPDMMFVINRDGIFLEYKAETGNEFSFPSEYYLNKKIIDVFPKSISDESSKLINLTLNEGKPQIQEYTLEIKGETRHYEARYVVSWDDEVLVIVRDITEMKRSFYALLESEAKFRILAETLPMAIFIYIGDNIIYSNPGTESLTGYSSAELLNIHYTDIVHPENLEIVSKRKIMRENNESVLSRYEVKIVTKNGEEKWIDFSTRSIEYKGNIASLGAAIDITDRKNVEEQLRKLSRAVEQSSVSVLITDANGNIEYVNPKFEKITGYSRDEAIGRNPKILKSGLKSSEEYKILWTSIMAGKDWHGEFLNKRKNGELYWQSTIISSIKNPTGEITHFLGIQEDITEHKIVEERLIQSEKDYRGLFENAHDAILIFNPDNGNILDANAEACRMYGYKRSEFIGMSFNNFSLDKTSEQFLVENILQKNIIKNYETTHIKRSREKINLEINATTIHYKSEKAILAVIRDITERKKYEVALLMAKEEAEQSDKLKSEFLAQMSHEIRTPINSILSFSALLKEELENRVSDDLKQAFTIIDNGGRRLIRTIDLILNMSQIQAGSYQITVDQVDLFTDILEHIYLEFSTQAKSKGLEFELINKAQNTCSNIDIYTVTQIISNLIDNGIKFTQHGKVILRIYNDVSNGICVDVEDTGIGISPEYMTKLFTPFSQEETGYTRSFEGNGLGLALVKKYADLNNASILVKSEKDKGTTFTVVFNNNHLPSQ